ncbi:MAG: DNA replication/repair protein RecF [Clostridia bacterium]|nr:DNA replication/repair protein RecF [Clostridia bacterium]
MYIESLVLKNFRNYADERFEFSDGVNVITGMNAQGKTNCAEAVFYLCTGYSPRAARDKQVIRYGQDKAYVSGNAKTAYGSVNVELTFYPDKKNIRINGVETLKMGELLGNINSVFFNPEELKLIKESPEDRRRFLDISLSQMNKKYFYALQKYKKILSQRNTLLKDENKDLIRETLPVWDAQLVKYAAIVIKERNEFLRLLSPFAAEAHRFITENREELEISAGYRYGGDENEIARQLLSDLAESTEKSIALGYTTIGPHRDDLRIKINGEEVKIYGSQGQQRTAALSMKLAELEVFNTRFHEYPVLLLDDALSELDCSRRARVLERAEGIQTIITCTETDDEAFTNRKFTRFSVCAGKIEKRE